MSLICGIDIGTSSTKTVLMDEEGHIVAKTSASYPLHTPKPGWVEQDPADWWRAVCETIHKVIHASSITPHEIKGLALSGQLNGAVFVDEKGEPLRLAPLWLDHRAVEECEWAQEKAGDLLRELALHKLNPVNTFAKLLWVKRNEAHIYERAHLMLIPKDWVRFKLTGRFASDVSDASVTCAFDLRKRDWAYPILDAFDVRHDLFPPVFESPEIVGEVTKEAAEETGLAPGTPVCAGGGDMPCMAVGGGVIAPGIVNVGIGTAGHVTTFAEDVSDAAFNQLWPMCHAVPGKYFWLGCTYTGGASLTWFRDTFGGSYDDLTEQAAQAPPGAEGLFFMPWLEGTATPHPDSNAKGVFLGLTLRHKRAHLIRALMEGVVFDLRHSLECFKRLGLPIEQIRIGEGGAKSALWRQIQADVFGKDVVVMETEDASAVGAAIVAAVGVSVFGSFEEACDAAIKLGETVPCNAERAALYDRLYRLYCTFYPTLKQTFAAVHDLL